MRDQNPTAAFVLIGNELLSGKVADENFLPLAQLLRRRGIDLRRVVAIPDEVDAIAAEVAELAGRHTWVFTSGGVGPTHDDVTITAVAQAFAVAVVRSPTLVAMLEQHYGDKVDEGHLRMAGIPEGGTLVTTPELRWPTLRMRNVWVLPGIPEVFRMKLAAVAAHLPHAAEFHSRAVYINTDETALVALIDAVAAAHPDVAVGSYPKWCDATYKTKVTFDSRNRERASAALDWLVAQLPRDEPYRTE